MGDTFRLILQTFAGLAIVSNILLMMISVPYIVDNYDTQLVIQQRRIELYVITHLFLSGIFVTYIFYEGFRNRQIKYFSITFSVIGIVLILLGSMIVAPYSSVEEVRTEFSRDLTRRIYNTVDDYERASYENGTLRVIPISPNSSETYVWDYNGDENTSIVQIDIGTTGQIFFILAELEQERDLITGERDIERTLFNWTLGHGPVLDWYTRFWTLPYWGAANRIIGFVFENPNDHEISVSLRVTEFYLKATREVEEVYYDTLLDQNYAYGGLVLLGVSVVLSTLWWPKDH